MKTIEELDKHIASFIQGGFGQADMAVMKEECEKLKPGDIYVEIGVDEGRSARVAHEYCLEGVYKIFIDIHDHGPVPGVTISRAAFMEQEGMVGLGKRGFYVHGDADEFATLLRFPISLLFIDGHHSCEDVGRNTKMWKPLVKRGGIIIYHDIDHPGVLEHLDTYYGKGNWENCHGKIGRVRI